MDLIDREQAGDVADANVGDMISRQAALNLLVQCAVPENGGSLLYQSIKQLPSAEKTGKWKPFDLTYGRNIYFCTACNNASEVPTSMGEPVYKFCPWCGSRMVE